MNQLSMMSYGEKIQFVRDTEEPDEQGIAGSDSSLSLRNRRHNLIASTRKFKNQ